jgi:hypothetical protein
MIRYRPVKISDSEIQIGNFTVNLKLRHCFSHADILIEKWNNLETEGFPLNDVSSSINANELSMLPRYRSTYPHHAHIVRFVDAICICQNMKGFDVRKNKLKENLTSIIEGSRMMSGQTIRDDYKKYYNNLVGTIVSATDEYRLAYHLKNTITDIEFTNSNREFPDFSTKSTTVTMLEAKSRFNRTFVGEDIKESKLIQLDQKMLSTLLCRDAVDDFEKAFEGQNAGILCTCLTWSEYGFLLAAYCYATDTYLDFNETVRRAMELRLNKNRQLVLLYTELVALQNVPEIVAILIDRKDAELKGKQLQKIESDYFRDNNKRLTFDELIEQARKL